MLPVSPYMYSGCSKPRLLITMVPIRYSTMTPQPTNLLGLSACTKIERIAIRIMSTDSGRTYHARYLPISKSVYPRISWISIAPTTEISRVAISTKATAMVFGTR